MQIPAAVEHVGSVVRQALLPTVAPASASYFLTRQLFLRGLGLIYAVAFLVALQQNKALLGERGILPVRSYLDSWERALHGRPVKDSGTGGAKELWRRWRRQMASFWQLPTLLWFARRDRLDGWLRAMAGCGLALSLVLLVHGTIPAVGALALWLLYQSIVNVGQTWYSFGWESQLLETGWLAVFLCPLWSLDAFKPSNPVPRAVVWAYRWLLFRIMLGAGLIKLRGGREWRDLTAMDYFYETQPVPNPLSYYMHQSPRTVHKFEVLMNHVVELVGPFLLLAPLRSLRLAGGMLQLVFQSVLISCGNLSFLNWLTALPAVWCLDDRFLSHALPLKPSAVTLFKAALDRAHPVDSAVPWWRWLVARDVGLVAALAVLSWPVVRNLLSPNQAMNRSFNQWHLVNTYGAFGTVTKDRYEVIIQGAVEYDGDSTEWREYVFKVKPGPTQRRPPIITPYHYRLDWLAWFLPLGGRWGGSYPRWFVSFLGKLGENDPEVTALLATNPFEGGPPPRYLRATLNQYKFSRLGSEEARAGQWWVREEVEPFFPMRSVPDIQRLMGY